MSKIIQIEPVVLTGFKDFTEVGRCALFALDDEGRISVKDYPLSPDSKWVLVDLPPWVTQPGESSVSPADPAPEPEPPAEPEPDSNADVYLQSIMLDARWPDGPVLRRGLPHTAAGYRIDADVTIPANWIGKPGEVYLFGIPELGGFQVFARTKNRWVCVGADMPWPWLIKLSEKVGQPLESGDDGKPAGPDHGGWVGMRYSRIEGNRFQISIFVPSDGGSATLQLGENRSPKPGSETKLPSGVTFNRIEVWAL